MNRIAFPALALVAALVSANAVAQVKIAQLDGLSGPFASVGEQQQKTLQAMVDEINTRGGLNGKKLELVSIDGKGSPQDSLAALKLVIDQKIGFVTQGNSSAVAGALSEAVAKHNQRNPDAPIVYFNHSGVDNDLTNSKCNFWHFRFDPNVSMKIEGITSELAKDKSVKKVYLINQNYSLGQQTSVEAKAILGRRRPDIKVVGDDLHALGQVKDFAPYVTKIKASDADTIITGNWGSDLALLVKAVKDSGLNVKLYTYYAGGFGAPTTLGDAGVGRVKTINAWNPNIPNNKSEKFANDFKKKYGIDLYFHPIRTMMQMFEAAAKQTKSNDPKKIALSLEGMKFNADTGEAEMRKQDHQILMPQFISTMQRIAAKGGPKDVIYDAESTGTVGFQTNSKIEAFVSATPTSCQMTRP
jgi:branched-chain amino acid transport system substrate-binding protein